MAIKKEKKIQNDLGLGDKVIAENRTRFLNKDGSFNVHKKGILETGNISPYHTVLNASWLKFNLGILVYYLIVNLIFAGLYFSSGRNAFPEITNKDAFYRFWELFFYSVQVITTLGSSPLKPIGLSAHVILGVEAMVGMLGFALGASLMFARFSNPASKIIFSQKGVIAPYEDITGFMVRIINGRSNELVDVEATLTLAMDDESGRRQFQILNLERDSVLVFPLNWTIVHPIDKDSPLYKISEADLEKRHAEFLLSIKGIDQDISKKMYARMSYLYNEVKFGARFKSIIERTEEGTVVVDPKRISEIEEL